MAANLILIHVLVSKPNKIHIQSKMQGTHQERNPERFVSTNNTSTQ